MDIAIMIFFFLIFYFPLTVVASSVFFEEYFLTDYDLSYNYFIKNNMNVLGAALSEIMLTVIAPFYMIPMFIYWICHVHKDDLQKLSGNDFDKDDYE